MKTEKTEESVGANEETLDKWSEPRYLGGLNPHKRLVSTRQIQIRLTFFSDNSAKKSTVSLVKGRNGVLSLTRLRCENKYLYEEEDDVFGKCV